jgi:hypothetical protein
MAATKDADTSDHDLLIRLDEKMDNILLRLGKGDDCMGNHETRISKLESFQNTILAFAGSVSLAVSVAGSWVLSQFRGG